MQSENVQQAIKHMDGQFETKKIVDVKQVNILQESLLEKWMTTCQNPMMQ